MEVAAARPTLEAHDLYRFYHAGEEETLALRGVSLAIAAGETVAVMGPSGSGKSTLLACLAGLDEPDGGYVVVDGTRLTRRSEGDRATIRARKIGILLQSGNLIGHLTVAENVALQLQLAHRSTGKRVSELLRAVGLETRGGSRADHLSGGETARAGLAIALAVDPPLILADEPTGEVDAQTEKRLLEMLDRRKAAGGATLVATHSEALAAWADRVIRLHDGRVVNE
ncbi:MAG TPA: ABC transporter ATP-binding protein [Candidatus Baltobacteraceae bacterium]